MGRGLRQFIRSSQEGDATNINMRQAPTSTHTHTHTQIQTPPKKKKGHRPTTGISPTGETRAAYFSTFQRRMAPSHDPEATRSE